MKNARALFSLSAAALVAGLPLTPRAAADTITAQPIGFMAAGAASSEPNDFYAEYSARGAKCLYFSIKVRDLPNNGGQVRMWYRQVLPELVPPVSFKIGATPRHPAAGSQPPRPAAKLNAFVLPVGQQITQYISADQLSVTTPYRMFYRVPGAGIYGTNRGGLPARVFAESALHPISGFTVRLNDYSFSQSDVTLQARLFFGGYSALVGDEPWISGGVAKGTHLLKNIGAARRVGSEPGDFCSLGAQNSTQETYFVADSPADTSLPGSKQLWQVIPKRVNRVETYGAVPFTNGSFLTGVPHNLIANGFDMLFLAPTPGALATDGDVVWRMKANGANTVADLSYYTNTLHTPRGLVFNHLSQSTSNAALTMLDNGGVRRFARFSSFADSVTILPGIGLKDPTLIEDAGDGFIFAATYEPDGNQYLIRHSFGDNSLTTVNIGVVAGFIRYPTNIREVCPLSADGTSGYVYFVADGDFSDGAGGVVHDTNVLFHLPIGDGSNFSTASPVLTGSLNRVHGAHNLRAVVSNGSPGIFRLYFAAQVTSEFSAVEQGVEPWVVEDE